MALLMNFNSTMASHLAGGDFSWECLGNDSFKIQLNLFRDCSGISAPTTASVSFNSSCGAFTSVLVLDSSGGNDISQICPNDQNNSTCQGGNLPGMELYTYESIVYLPPCSTGVWDMSYDVCCRNGSIVNISNPSNENLTISAQLYPGGCNNSPKFGEQTVLSSCVNQTASYNFGVTESDGDSLKYSLACAENNAGCLTYILPYTPSSPIDGITIDPNTGQIDFTPTQIGAYVLVMQVTELDDVTGDTLSIVKRDIQFLVTQCTGSMPDLNAGTLDSIVGGTVNGNSIDLCGGQNLSFCMTYSDSNISDTLSLITNLNTVLPGATWTTSGTNPIQLCVNWTPAGISVGQNNNFVVNVSDGACPIPNIQTFSYDINVNGTSAGPDKIICGSQSATLQASGGSSFVWTVISGDPINVGANFSCDTCATAIATPNVTTTYLVTSNLTGGCNTDTITVNVVPSFSLSTVQSDTSACRFDSVGFTTTPTPGGNYSFNWHPAWIFSNDTAASTIAGFATPGPQTIWVDVTSADGCNVKDTLHVTVSSNPVPDLAISGDLGICVGDTTQLHVNNSDCIFTVDMYDSFGDGWNGARLDIFINGVLGKSFTFNTGSFASDTILILAGDSISIFHSSGSYPSEESYYITDQNGDTIWWDTSNPQNGLVWSGVCGSGCQNTNPDVVYGWFPNTNINATDTLCPWVWPATTTTYSVWAHDTVGGCSDTASVTIMVGNHFNLDISQTDTTICGLDSLEFTAIIDTNATPATYLWSPSNIFFSDTNQTVVGGFGLGDTTVVIVEATSAQGCTEWDSVNIYTSSNPIPVILIQGDNTICDGESSDLCAINQSQVNATSDSFDGGINSGIWANVTGTSGLGCSSFSGDALWFDNSGTREAQSIDFNCTSGGTIDFYLMISDGSVGTSCENADAGEDVVLEYSIDGGTSWVIINTYSENSTPNFTLMSEPIPVAAQTFSTRFRWRQLSNSGAGFDNWAIDEVGFIFAGSGSGSYFSWSPVYNLSYTNADSSCIIVTPTVDTTYQVVV
ncbi:MAG: hypothetical protein MRY83_11050, partial [Flavobacteriales bacterium]|nr:hypothetical protein [Flavobacteriales bacterium]